MPPANLFEIFQHFAETAQVWYLDTRHLGELQVYALGVIIGILMVDF